MHRLKRTYTILLQRLKYQNFIKILLLILIFFIGYHALIWFFYTSKLLGINKPMHIGDLARTGYYTPSAYLRKTYTDLPKTHIEFQQWQGQPIDIMTLGDSFSNGGAGGHNAFYQDYLATKYNYNVLNINQSLFKENYIEAIVAMINSGVIDRIQPKAILIESVERFAIGRLSQPINWNRTLNSKLIFKDFQDAESKYGKPLWQKQLFITTANYKLPLYNFYYLFSPDAFGYSGACKLHLNKPLFNANASTVLLTTKDEINSISSNTKENSMQMNNNLNHLAKLLHSKNIPLFVMIAVDKYDLYYDHIINNPYPKNTFFDSLRPLEKEYNFIDTKAILYKELEKGSKDLFFADDTHWSNKASDEITAQCKIKQ